MNHRNEKIQFKRQRSIGEILSDTFAFIRLEYRGLLKALVRFAGIPFLLLLAASGYSTATATSMDFLTTGNIFTAGGLLLNFSLIGVATAIYYGFMFSTVLNYIKYYIAGPVDLDRVGTEVKNDFGGIIGLSFLTAIMLFIGFMLCFFPGVYLSVPLALVFSIYIFQNLSVTDSISESFSLVKNEWWTSFLTFVVIYIIVYLIGMIFQIPALVYMLIKSLSQSQEVSAESPSEMFDWVYIVLNIIASAASYLFYTIIVIASAFIYFNLNEKKNQTGTLEQIDTIGSDI